MLPSQIIMFSVNQLKLLNADEFQRLKAESSNCTYVCYNITTTIIIIITTIIMMYVIVVQ